MISYKSASRGVSRIMVVKWLKIRLVVKSIKYISRFEKRFSLLLRLLGVRQSLGQAYGAYPSTEVNPESWTQLKGSDETKF